MLDIVCLVSSWEEIQLLGEAREDAVNMSAYKLTMKKLRARTLARNMELPVDLDLFENDLASSPVNWTLMVGLFRCRLCIFHQNIDWVIYPYTGVLVRRGTDVTAIVVLQVPFVHALLHEVQNDMMRQILKYHINVGRFFSLLQG